MQISHCTEYVIGDISNVSIDSKFLMLPDAFGNP